MGYRRKIYLAGTEKRLDVDRGGRSRGIVRACFNAYRVLFRTFLKLW